MAFLETLAALLSVGSSVNSYREQYLAERNARKEQNRASGITMGALREMFGSIDPKAMSKADGIVGGHKVPNRGGMNNQTADMLAGALTGGVNYLLPGKYNPFRKKGKRSPSPDEILWAQRMQELKQYQVQAGSNASKFAPVGVLTPGARTGVQGITGYGMDKGIFEARRSAYNTMQNAGFSDADKQRLGFLSNYKSGAGFKSAAGVQAGDMMKALQATVGDNAGASKADTLIQAAIATRQAKFQAANQTKDLLAGIYGTARGTY